MGLIARFLDVIYPPACVLCEKTGYNPLCPTCLSGLEPSVETFVYPGFNLLTILPYESVVRKVMHKMKFEGFEELGILLAEIAAPYLTNMQPMTIVPVPMHPLKIRQRGYNQTAIIAKKLSKILSWPYSPRLVWRKKNTKPQFELDIQEKTENVENAFACYPFAKVNPETQYLMVDDIVTTGATFISFHDVLRHMGARKLTALAIARAFNYPVKTIAYE